MSTVQELMTRVVITVRPEQTMDDVAEAMQQGAVRHLAVVDGQRTLCGVISVHDFPAAPAARVADVMSQHPITVAPDTPASEAVVKMLQHRINSLPVVDEARTVVGIITSTDLLMVAYDALRKSELEQPISRRGDVEHAILMAKLERVQSARHPDSEAIALRELRRFLQRRFEREQAEGGRFATWVKRNPSLGVDVADLCEAQAQLLAHIESLENQDNERAQRGNDNTSPALTELIATIEEHEALKNRLHAHSRET